MQDPAGVRSMATSCGRIFGDRRLRPHPNQSLKCPRCDSPNTKFCYYNNYNLSQPRHFCKNCRRYWTKGGVLRNVPVGGGCRKTKRSKQKTSTDLQKESPSVCKSNSHSSSESSSLTATEASSSSIQQLPEPSLIDPILPFPESRLFTSPTPKPSANPNSGLESGFLDILPETLTNPSSTMNSGSFLPESGTFTSLITSSNPSILGFNFSDLPFRLQHQKFTSMVEELKAHELTAGLMDQTASIVDLPNLQSRTSNVGLTALDWQCGGTDSNMFDLPSTVDTSYWNQSHWGEGDPSSLYHLP